MDSEVGDAGCRKRQVAKKNLKEIFKNKKEELQKKERLGPPRKKNLFRKTNV